MNFEEIKAVLLEKFKEVIYSGPSKKVSLHKLIISLEQSDNNFILTYSSDNFSVNEKKEIEKLYLDSMKSEVDPDEIIILSKSSEKKINNNNQKSIKNDNKQPGIPPKKKLHNIDKVIAVSSGKGGVGKSTFAVNLAVSLKNQGHKVGILDADIYGPSVPLLMGKRNAKPEAVDEKISPIESHGVKFVSFGLFVEESKAVIWRGPMLGGVLKQFLFDVSWGDLDYLIIDLPPGTGDMQLSLAQQVEIDGVITVCTPQEVAALDAFKSIEMFKQLKINHLGVVQNMSYFIGDDSDKKYYIFGEGNLKDKCDQFGISLLGEIPLEIELREGSDNGIPYMTEEKFNTRPVWNSFMSTAKEITEKL
ncbi:MAG: Mrp/NBP35 family ATP-binding protein [Bdellovibrionales bacterium]|jgi:ATP-binding protein involved in chromosome partitioning|nr:Mrp/NBP35 family ATP-binding protein [Bdellovibrionales bacterium]